MRRNRWDYGYRRGQEIRNNKRTRFAAKKVTALKRPEKKYARRPKRVRIIAPTELNLLNKAPRKNTIDFIAKIRRCAASGQSIFLDLSGLERIFSCGTLLLLAEVDRLRRIL